jgi:DNA-binding XRE family transcriptional regulator
MSQAELASQMGTSQSFISRLERGLANPRASTIERLAEVLDAAIRLELIPWEQWRGAKRAARWWSAQSHPLSLSEPDRIATRESLPRGSDASTAWVAGLQELLRQMPAASLPESQGATDAKA